MPGKPIGEDDYKDVHADVTASDVGCLYGLILFLWILIVLRFIHSILPILKGD
jgi:hypothetical protein